MDFQQPIDVVTLVCNSSCNKLTLSAKREKEDVADVQHPIDAVTFVCNSSCSNRFVISSENGRKKDEEEMDVQHPIDAVTLVCNSSCNNWFVTLSENKGRRSDGCPTMTSWKLKLDLQTHNVTHNFIPSFNVNISNERGESTTSYRWRGWVWEIPGFKFKTSKILPIFIEKFVEYTFNQ